MAPWKTLSPDERQAKDLRDLSTNRLKEWDSLFTIPIFLTIMTGTISIFDKPNGFGFIVGENDTEYYTRFDGLTDEEKAKAEEGMPVSFELQDGLRGEEAIQVRLL